MTHQDDAPTVVGRSGPATAAVRTERIGHTLIDRYVLRETLGRGGMGEVVLATDLQIGREVAIKRMHAELESPELEARFLREAHVQGQLQHPAVVPVYELATDEVGRWYFVMKRLVGVTLGAILARRDADYPRERLLRAFVDVCRAIELAHSRGIVHRNLKPANIMLGEHGEVYVLDWGIARVDPAVDAFGGAEPHHDLLSQVETAAGAVMGTYGYMPPEQIASAGAVSSAADVYSLGCVLFEILAGEPLHPLGEAALASTVVGIDARPSIRASWQVPPELDELCTRAVALTAAERPTAGELAQAIERYMDGDRDLAARRTLAASHFARAQQALAGGDDEHARRVAMREAGRALAFDPDLGAAAELVGWLVLQPPSVPPREVEANLAADDERALRSQARLAGFSLLGYFLFVPLLAWIGVRDWSYIAVLAGLALLCSIAAFMVAKWPRRWAVLLNLAVQVVLLAWVAHMFSPFLVAPGIGVATMVILASQPQIISFHAVYLATMLAIAGPWLLEALEVLPATMHIQDGNLLITAPAMEVSSPALGIVLTIELAALLLSTAYTTSMLTRAHRISARSVRLAEWHLRQLV